MIEKLEGIIPPMVTPLTATYELDTPGLKKLIDHMIDGGVHGLFVLGTTGEFAGLSTKVKIATIQEAGKWINGRVPLLVGITDTCMEESLQLAHMAHKCGAQAVVAAPPYYFHLGQEELVEYYWDLAGKLPLPLFLYNIPSLTKIELGVNAVKELSKHPNIIGLKDSSGNLEYFKSMCNTLKSNRDFILMVGPEELMVETVMLGSKGGVNGGANLFPELYVALFNAIKAKDFERSKMLQNLVAELGDKIYNLGKYSSGYLKGLKGALDVLGLCNGYLTPPLKPFSKTEKDQVSENLKHLKATIGKVV